MPFVYVYIRSESFIRTKMRACTRAVCQVEIPSLVSQLFNALERLGAETVLPYEREQFTGRGSPVVQKRLHRDTIIQGFTVSSTKYIKGHHNQHRKVSTILSQNTSNQQFRFSPLTTFHHASYAALLVYPLGAYRRRSSRRSSPVSHSRLSRRHSNSMLKRHQTIMLPGGSERVQVRKLQSCGQEAQACRVSQTFLRIRILVTPFLQ